MAAAPAALGGFVRPGRATVEAAPPQPTSCGGTSDQKTLTQAPGFSTPLMDTAPQTRPGRIFRL
jgi:hypothetical protein